MDTSCRAISWRRKWGRKPKRKRKKKKERRRRKKAGAEGIGLGYAIHNGVSSQGTWIRHYEWRIQSKKLDTPFIMAYPYLSCWMRHYEWRIQVDTPLKVAYCAIFETYFFLVLFI